MDKRFLAFLIGVALVLGGIFLFTNDNKAGAPTASTKGKVTNHIKGSSTSGVKIVEYGDFQCPACAQYFPAAKAVAEKYSSQVSFQFRNFPLFQIHPNAIAASRAAEAADLQGKFWEMHDLLYENQQSWTTATDPTAAFNQYAQKLNLNTEKFKTDYKSTVANDRIQADLKEGNRLGVESTPTFFINGKKISNPEPTVEGFSKIIDAEIAKQAGASKPATAKPAETPAPTAEPAPAQ